MPIIELNIFVAEIQKLGKSNLTNKIYYKFKAAFQNTGLFTLEFSFKKILPVS